MSSTFYILVLRGFDRNRYVNNFLVLPNSEIRRLVESSVILKSEKMSLRIEKNSNEDYILNGRENISRSLNRYDTIV